MSANENDLELNVDPSERTGETREASPQDQDDIELNVDPSEGPVEPPQ